MLYIIFLLPYKYYIKLQSITESNLAYSLADTLIYPHAARRHVHAHTRTLQARHPISHTRSKRCYRFADDDLGPSPKLAYTAPLSALAPTPRAFPDFPSIELRLASL